MVADVTVVGSGIIALACALEAADRGVRVRLIGTAHHGEASPAAAGMLAPSVERELGPLHDVARASRDLYPAYLAALAARTGVHVPRNALGILEVATSAERAARLRRTAEPPSEWLERSELLALEPGITPAAVGGVRHPDDGAVDPLALLDALRTAVARHERITVVREDVQAVRGGAGGAVVTTDGDGRFESEHVLLAAGAWTPLIAGVPPIPVAPVRGQMVAYDAAPLRHVVYGETGYLVPRHDGHTAAGSTMEHAGFDATVTDSGVAAVRHAAEATAPALASAALHAAWAGLRPVTPDGRPILGPDPEHPRLVYACGHSRNGILLTPITALLVADLLTGTTPRHDVSQFRAGRFSG